MLRAHGVRVVLGRAAVLHGVSLAVEPGEVVAVVGPNGAGKSTLLAVLSGTLAPGAGQVGLEGRPLSEWTPRALACKRAVLPQHSELAFSFRVLEVVLLGRSPHAGAGGRERDLAVAQASLAATGTGHLADRVYTTLSGGERRRVQLARVLAQIGFPATNGRGAGRYLLLDEPTAGLDLAYQHTTLETAREAAGRGVGVVAILHDLNLAAVYADRIAVLHGGHVAAEGTPEKVLTESMVRDSFNLSVRIIPHPVRRCPHVVAC